MKTKDSSGESIVQQSNEKLIVDWVAHKHGVGLKRRELPGSSMEFDGLDSDESMLCEAYAHVGGLKPGQIKKVMNDAIRLIFGSELIFERTGKRPRLILAFCDKQAAASFNGTGWRSDLLRYYKIKTEVALLPDDCIEAIRKAQVRQKR